MASKTNTECGAFERLATQVLSVPHAVIVKREAAYKKQGPHKRGPKPKVTEGASRAAV
ncbi:MAG TPA: hypothetical protein VNF74_09750 [Terriglobales bacterium]|nr:hypothetical protein [Terriglobales bacterium]